MGSFWADSYVAAALHCGGQDKVANSKCLASQLEKPGEQQAVRTDLFWGDPQ